MAANSALHEILAVESSLSATSMKLLKEAQKTCGKDNLFTGHEKTHEIFNEENQHLVQPPEVVVVETNVKDVIEYALREGFAPFVNAVAQKDATNQVAKADIIIGDTVVASDVPGTTLLGLESKLNSILEVFTVLPTLAPGIQWVEDESKGEGIMRSATPQERQQEIRPKDWKEIVPPTEHHPAIIKEVETKEIIGKFIVQQFSGAISSAKKAEIIKRLQVLMHAVKQARQRANQTTVVHSDVGDKIANYLVEGF